VLPELIMYSFLIGSKAPEKFELAIGSVSVIKKVTGSIKTTLLDVLFTAQNKHLLHL